MKCKTCGKNADSEYCFAHKPRKPLPSSSGKGLSSKKANSEGVIIYTTGLEMKDFFMSIWNKRPHRSEVSNTFLSKEPSSAYFHHILPKEKYPEAKFDEDNIILLTFDEHNNVENDMYKYEEINERRKHLKLKYERA
jgi:uncharacterized protein YvpB